MTSVARIRERPLPIRRGRTGSKTHRTRLIINGITFQDSTFVTKSGPLPDGHARCQDRLTLSGDRIPQEFDLKVEGYSPGLLQGSYSYKPNQYYTYDYTYTTFTNSRLGSIWNTGVKTYTPESHDYWLTVLLAKLSRSKPAYHLPNVLWELREFPSLLKHVGEVLGVLSKVQTKRSVSLFTPDGLYGSPYYEEVTEGISASEGWLAFNFGWRPLVSDVLALFDVAEKVNNRINRLKRARAGRSFRERLQSFEEVSVVASNYDFETVILDIIDTRNVKIWATGVWDNFDNSEVQTLIDELSGQYGELAKWKHSYGLSPSSLGVDLWNSIPWSFLIDYFANVGTLIEANQNKYGVVPKDVCIMINDQAVETSRVVLNPHRLSYTPHVYHREAKTRRAYLEPNGKLVFRPILRWRQIANLAALATAPRIRGYYVTS